MAEVLQWDYLLMQKSDESASRHDEANHTTKLRIQRSDHAGDELNLMPDPAGLTQKSERTKEKVTYKMHWLVPWFENWHIEAALLEKAPQIKCDPVTDGRLEDQPLPDW